MGNIDQAKKLLKKSDAALKQSNLILEGLEVYYDQKEQGKIPKPSKEWDGGIA
jgi:hypothetical protein